MVGDFGAVGVALFVAFFVKAGLDRIAAVIRAKWPNVELGLPFGIAAMVLGAGIGWLANVNVLAALPIDPVLGRVLTAVAIGLGIEFLNDILATVQGRRGTDVVVLPDVEPVESLLKRVVGGESAAEAGFGPRVMRVRRIGPPVRGW